MEKGKGKAAAQDVLIAVMGLTGSGKSTFISHCTESKVGIGSSLKSYTQNIETYPYTSPSSGNVLLIDTPGFDDTNRSDDEILREIAAWVTGIYKKKILLRGILYLHRITDDRMQGSAKNNIFLLRKLCGKDAMKNTVLVTTMWENLPQPEDGERRETELKSTPDFWGAMIQQGSRVERHNNNKESATQILEKLLSSNTAIKLAIQEEMVDQGKDLNETGAGSELNLIFDKKLEGIYQYIKRLEEDIKEAKDEDDKMAIKELRELQQKKDAEIDHLRKQQETLQISLEKLLQQQAREARQRKEQEENALERARAEEEQRQTRLTEERRQAVASANRKRNQPLSLSPNQNPQLAQRQKRTDKMTAEMSSVRLGKGTEKSKNIDVSSDYWRSGASAMSGNFYYFSGENARNQLVERSNLPRDLTLALQARMVGNDGNEQECISLGLDGAYFHTKYDLEKPGKSRTESGNLEQYPDLSQYLQSKEYAQNDFIQLGTPPFWLSYCHPEKGNLPDGCPRNTYWIWFGYQGSYVTFTSQGSGYGLYWDLRGQYKGLEKHLQSWKRSNKYPRLENGTDWIAMEPEQSEGFPKKYKCTYLIQDAKVEQAFEEWLESFPEA